MPSTSVLISCTCSSRLRISAVAGCCAPTPPAANANPTVSNAARMILAIVKTLPCVLKISRSVFEPCAALCELDRKKGLTKRAVVLCRQDLRGTTRKWSRPVAASRQPYRRCVARGTLSACDRALTLPPNRGPQSSAPGRDTHAHRCDRDSVDDGRVRRLG